MSCELASPSITKSFLQYVHHIQKKPGCPQVPYYGNDSTARGAYETCVAAGATRDETWGVATFVETVLPYPLTVARTDVADMIIKYIGKQQPAAAVAL
jgi:hypothetical protein